jgi:hypothetical protein
MRIVSTWNGKGDFTVKHVQALAKQLDEHASFTTFECLTNEKIPGVICHPLRYNWPGWWVKMEAFAPDIKGDILYMDIDTVILGSLDDILQVKKLTLLRDFYRNGKNRPGGLMGRRPPNPEGLQSSLMFSTEEDRIEPWNYFSKNPRMCMETYRPPRGDQEMIEQWYLKPTQRWQDILPGQIVSWKVDCCGSNEFQTPVIPKDARVVIFHGQPRPWAVDQFKDLYQ